MKLLLSWLLLLSQTCLTQTVSRKDLINTDIPEKEVALGPADFAEAHLHGDPDLSGILEGDPLLKAGKFEGDIAGQSPSKIQQFIKDSNYVGRNAIRNRYQRWPEGKIPYTMSSRYGSTSRRVIAGAMEEFHRRTCIRFVPRTTQRNYVYIHPDDGCYSLVGRIGGRQPLSLDAGCLMKGTVMHELMHATGFFHEQSRADRDEYITIVKDNLLPKTEDQFQKYSLRQITHLGTKYDYGSIMHYSQFAFSRRPGRRGGETIIAKDTAGQRLMGNRRDFSKNDVYKLNKLYNCEDKLDETDIDGDEDSDNGDGASGGDCEDDRWDCKIRKFLGYCDYDRETQSNCAKTCKRCSSGGSGGGGSRRSTTTTTTRRPDTNGGSGGGTSGCADKKDKCQSWADRDYCTKFQKYMRANCPKACSHCTPTSGSGSGSSGGSGSRGRWTTTTKRVTPTPPSSISTCKNRNHHCADWAVASKNFCNKYPMYMKKNCAKACGFCEVREEGAAARERSATRNCRDLHRKCSEYKEDGFCQAAPSSQRKVMMETYCKKSCGLC